MQSLGDMSINERQSYTRRVKKVVEDRINQTLPRAFQVKLTDVQKQCYQFVRNLQSGQARDAPSFCGSANQSGFPDGYSFLDSFPTQRSVPANKSAISDLFSGQ